MHTKCVFSDDPVVLVSKYELYNHEHETDSNALLEGMYIILLEITRRASVVLFASGKTLANINCGGVDHFDDNVG